MPTEFYGGVGVDLLYPTTLGMNPYSEPEWTSANIAPLPATDYTHHDPYPTPDSTRQQQQVEASAIPPHMANIPRPKSSPSTFGPNVEDLLFQENPYKFKPEDYQGAAAFTFPSPVPSTKSSPYYGGQEYPGSARSSPARHVPVAIAPDPVGMRQLQSMKRLREEDDGAATDGALSGQRKRKRASSNSGPVELNEEEQLLLKLKEEENLPWKDIAARFQSDLGKTYQVPALQMRFKRLRERMRTWSEADRSKRHTSVGRTLNSSSQLRNASSVPPPNISAPMAGRTFTPIALPRHHTMPLPISRPASTSGTPPPPQQQQSHSATSSPVPMTMPPRSMGQPMAPMPVAMPPHSMPPSMLEAGAMFPAYAAPPMMPHHHPQTVAAQWTR